MSLEKILISACLLGEKVRYDGQSKPLKSQLIDNWQSNNQLVVICPEVAGGLPVPRLPAEVTHRNPIIVTNIDGYDVTQYFKSGAQKALALCQKYRIKYALLKERSPSCGSQKNYDGSFSNHLIDQQGVTTELLQQHGITVFSEETIEKLALALNP